MCNWFYNESIRSGFGILNRTASPATLCLNKLTKFSDLQLPPKLHPELRMIIATSTFGHENLVNQKVFTLFCATHVVFNSVNPCPNSLQSSRRHRQIHRKGSYKRVWQLLSWVGAHKNGLP